MRIELEPPDGPVDETLRIRLTGIPPGELARLALSAVDARGCSWRSETAFRADEAGAVDTARAAPVEGGYATVDPDGPVWSMAPAAGAAASSLFAAPADQLEVRVEADAGGARASEVAVRRFAAPGVDRRDLQGEGWLGRLYLPARPGARPAVAIIPGMTGPGAMEPAAALLASRGFAALVVASIAEPGLPATLCEVPLETLTAAVRELARHERVDPARLGVLGASVGAEGALAALSLLPARGVRAVCAIAPSSVVWQAVGEGRPPRTSSWSRGGKPLPWLRMRGERLVPQLVRRGVAGRVSGRARPVTLLGAYAAGLRDARAAAAAAIPVERIEAPILFVSGADDRVWPAAAMVESMLARRRAAGRTDDRHLAFEDAGHALRVPITPTTVTWTESLLSGGTPEGVARAQAEAWAAILAFLHAELHGDRPDLQRQR